MLGNIEEAFVNYKLYSLKEILRIKGTAAVAEVNLLYL